MAGTAALGTLQILTLSTGKLETTALGFAHPAQQLLHVQDTIRIIVYCYTYHRL